MTTLRTNTIAAVGAATTTTGSVYFDGTGDYLIVNAQTLNSNQWTLECWIYPTNLTGNKWLFSQYAAGDANRTSLYIDDGILLVFNGNQGSTSGNSTLSTNQWYHLAFVRNGSTLTAYLNGVQEFQKTNFAGPYQSNTYIGSYDGSSGTDNFQGYISNVRVVNSILYSSNFTPPTEELEVVDGTVLLCCQSAINTTEEKTGKVISAIGDRSSGTLGVTATDSPIAVADVNPGLTKKVDEPVGPTLDGKLEFNSQNYIVLPKGTSSQYGVLRDTQDVVGPDRDWYDNLVLAMPFNEATGLRDISSRNRNPGAYGNVAISTAQSKYYGSSAYFDGSGDLITVGITSDLQFTNNIDFTIELWGYKGASATNVNFFTLGDSKLPSGLELYVGTTGTITKVYTNNATRIEADSNPSNFAWHHYAVVRESGTLKLYIDGNVQSQTYDASSNQFGSDKTVVLSLGREYYDGSYTGLDLLGHLQDFRIYKGIAKYTANFTPPERIAETGVGFKTGALRYNTDSNKPELYDGNQWTELQISNVGLGTDGDTGPGARGVIGGGFSPTFGAYNTIDYINISSTGDALYFGDLTTAKWGQSSCASSTRGLIAGGYDSPTNTNIIYFITIASTGNAQYFGDLTYTTRASASCSSSTRGIFAGGYAGSPAYYNNIDYVTIASTGNAKDFGDSIFAGAYKRSCSSPTRGLFGGGTTAPTTRVNTIDFITISTLGEAEDFGDLTEIRDSAASCSNSTRGLFGGGSTPTRLNTVDFVIISTLGNAVNFGDLTQSRHASSAVSSSTRGVWSGGVVSNAVSRIDYVSLLTQGNAVDFGNLTISRGYTAACSNAHGGL